MFFSLSVLSLRFSAILCIDSNSCSVSDMSQFALLTFTSQITVREEGGIRDSRPYTLIRISRLFVLYYIVFSIRLLSPILRRVVYVLNTSPQLRRNVVDLRACDPDKGRCRRRTVVYRLFFGRPPLSSSGLFFDGHSKGWRIVYYGLR